MNEEEHIDDAAKQMLVNSKLELSNAMFGQVLMGKVVQIEQRKARVRQISALIVLVSGILVLVGAVIFYARQATLVQIPFVSVFSGVVPHYLQLTGEWVLAYLKYFELLIALYAVKTVIESQVDFA